jgi:hypothetical protein
MTSGKTAAVVFSEQLVTVYQLYAITSQKKTAFTDSITKREYKASTLKIIV